MPRACLRETRCSRHRSSLTNHNHHFLYKLSFVFNLQLRSCLALQYVCTKNSTWDAQSHIGILRLLFQNNLKKTSWMNAWPRREFEEHYLSSFITVPTPQLCSSVLPLEKASLARFLQVLPPGADCGGFDARKIPTCSPLPLLLCTPTRHHTTRLPTNWTQATKTEPVIRTNSCTFGTSYKLVSQILFHRWGSH